MLPFLACRGRPPRGAAAEGSLVSIFDVTSGWGGAGTSAPGPGRSAPAAAREDPRRAPSLRAPARERAALRSRSSPARTGRTGFADSAARAGRTEARRGRTSVPSSGPSRPHCREPLPLVLRHLFHEPPHPGVVTRTAFPPTFRSEGRLESTAGRESKVGKCDCRQRGGVTVAAQGRPALTSHGIRASRIRVGWLARVRERFDAIPVKRRIKHPAAFAIPAGVRGLIPCCRPFRPPLRGPRAPPRARRSDAPLARSGRPPARHRGRSPGSLRRPGGTHAAPRGAGAG